MIYSIKIFIITIYITHQLTNGIFVSKSLALTKKRET
jgi:hypothetical protein